MRDRRPKEGHDPIAHDLIHRPLVTVDRFHQTREHGVEQLTRLLGMPVREQLHGSLQVSKEHCDMLALAFEGASGGEDFLDQMERRVCMRSTCLIARWHRHCGRTSSPDQDSFPLVDRHLLGLDELGLEIFEVVIVQVELPFEGAIGHAASALEHGHRLVQDLFKGHCRPSIRLVCATGVWSDPYRLLTPLSPGAPGINRPKTG
jgi:hypothetical protein